MAAEGNDDSAGDGQGRDVAVGSHRRAADERRPVGRLEEQAGVLRLADGPLVDQHDRLAPVQRLAIAGRYGLEEMERAVRETVYADEGTSELGGVARPFGVNPRRDRPGSPTGIAAHIEDDPLRILEPLKHRTDLSNGQPPEV